MFVPGLLTWDGRDSHLWGWSHFLKSLLRNYIKEFPAFSGIHEAVAVMESWEVYQRRIYSLHAGHCWALPWEENFY